MPAVSVILPVYNSEKFIRASVESILNQTFGDFEFIIIDDCSTDDTYAILQEFKDKRIRLIRNEVNLKVVKTLNKGLSMAKGELIARMDADDISHPQRFQQQVTFLRENPEVDLCGTWVQTFGAEHAVMRAATEHEHIKVRLFFVNPMFHPAVMFRRESFKTHNLVYDDHYTNAEDYGMWVKAIDVLRFANIPKILLKYRIHATNVSVLKESNKKVLDDIHANIYAFFLKKLKVDYTEKELLMQRKLGLVKVGPLSLPELKDYLLWLKKLIIANNTTRYFDKGHFNNVVLSYILYLSKLTPSKMQALQLIYKIMGNLYNINDCAGFLISRTKVKLHPVEKF